MGCLASSWGIWNKWYKAKKARKLLQQKGLLAEPEGNKGKCLSDNIVTIVQPFYQNDMFSRCLPGAKNFVNIENKEHMRKRLILSNLFELYQAFKSGISNSTTWFFKILFPKTKGLCNCRSFRNSFHFSLFYTPERYVTCWCLAKQHVLESAIETYCLWWLKQRIHDVSVLSMSWDSELRAFLFELLQEFDDISFKQWQNTDSFLLMTHSAPIKEYIDMLFCAVEKLCSHWFLAKSQSDFLCRCKIEPRHGNAVILLEFAENFRFVVQDEVQGFHWTNLQCTLHPVVVYYKFNGEICHKSFWYIAWCQYDPWNSKISFWKLESWTPTHLSIWIFLWWLCCSIQE